MVQRKATNKLGIQADSKNSVKSEKWSTTLKTSSSQHQDIRNKGGGTELKKKMKKSRSIKLSDLESLGSSPMRRAKSRLDKAPTEASAVAATPQRPSLIKIPDASPNYMKPTSSSDARRERLQVSPCSSQASPASKSPTRRNLNYSKPSSASGHKPVKTPTKTSSLKPVRTLTKTSSFKTGRPSIRNSGVALYPNLNVGRDTCSSTLKDSKFPAYVTLQPGGTESEGISVMKVCPYTYCSLNGHHHAPLPPLKRFLSARRRMLKTQKSMRLKGLSQLRVKPSAEQKDIDTGQMAFNGDPEIQETDAANLAISPLRDELDMDFFVEIYAKPREDTVESIGGSIHDCGDEEIIDFSVNSEMFDDSLSARDDVTSVGNDDGKVAKSLPDESSYSEISFEDDLDKEGDLLMAEMYSVMIFPEHYQQVEVEDEDDLPYLIQADTCMEYCCIENDSEGGSPANTELGESVPEATTMDWNDMQVVAMHLDNGSKLDGPGVHNEPVIKSDDIVSDYSEEVPVDGEVPQEVYEENGRSSNTGFGGGDQTMEIDASSSTTREEFDSANSLSQCQLSSAEDAFEKPAGITDEENGDFECDENFIEILDSSASAETPVEEQTTANYSFINVVDSSASAEDLLKELTATSEEEEKEQIDYAIGLLGFQITDSSQGFLEIDQETAKKDQGSNHQNIEVGQCNAISEVKSLGLEVVDESLPPERQGQSSENQSDISHVVESQEISEKEQTESGDSTDFKVHSNSERNRPSSADNSLGENKKMKAAVSMELDPTPAEACLIFNNSSRPDVKKAIINADSNYNQLPKNCRTVGGKRHFKDLDEQRKFNPREPHYLPVEPDLEAEKVDLRHQMMDERKNAEEWMLDYALRQAVNKLAPARKRRVALLVEAFETVMPLPKFESHLRHTPSFAHARPIQACN